METPAAAFEERLLEIQAYLDFLGALEEQVRSGPPKVGTSGQTITTQQQRILYASVYLQLYNLVESTVTRCIDAVTPELSNAIRREWVRVTARTHADLTYDKRLVCAVDLFERIATLTPISNFRVEKGASGNWTDTEIEALGKRLDLPLNLKAPVRKAVKQPVREAMGALALVKHLRNKLAHGDISFAECGDGASVAELRDLTSRTAIYLRAVVQSFVKYIENSGYLASPQTAQVTQ